YGHVLPRFDRGPAAADCLRAGLPAAATAASAHASTGRADQADGRRIQTPANARGRIVSPVPPYLQKTLAVLRHSGAEPICRLGLATRGESQLQVHDVMHALDRGVNFLNWCGCGHADVLSRTVAALGTRRKEVVVCVQFEARTAAAAATELAWILRELNSDYIDALTLYYVEETAEWQQIIAPGGALGYCRAAQQDGIVRWLGVTSHQRRLAAAMAQSRLLDFLMIRYNAAHRGAETDVFPITDSLSMPVVVYTCLRWGALLQSTPDDPPGFIP